MMLLDERSHPSLRHVLGRALAHADGADFAIARIRLAGLDLSGSETARVRSCRVLVGRVNADTFAEAEASAARDPARRENLRTLHTFLGSGRLEVRAAGANAWAPDFSVLRGSAMPEVGSDAVALIGAHYFAKPAPASGPALTCAITEPAAVAAALSRFEELWYAGYEVTAVMRELLERLLDDAPG